MAFDNRLPPDDPSQSKDNNPLYDDGNITGSTGILPDIVQQNPQVKEGRRIRQLIKWRVPGLGFVDMYINPQQMNIQEKKVTKQQRTKGGYIIQYWGEELIRIKLSGTTGASGIEGINILRKVYRAEQDSFKQVEQTLADRLQNYNNSSSLTGIVSKASSGDISGAAGGILNSVMGESANPSLLPTLGSLALSVEMYYQGWVFKGYFDSFDYEESTSNNGVGVFRYNLEFIVVDRRGIRSNFMPWHRSPATLDSTGNPIGYNKSDASAVPLSFNGEKK
jgi:hypothetical protein